MVEITNHNKGNQVPEQQGQSYINKTSLKKYGVNTMVESTLDHEKVEALNTIPKKQNGDIGKFDSPGVISRGTIISSDTTKYYFTTHWPYIDSSHDVYNDYSTIPQTDRRNILSSTESVNSWKKTRQDQTYNNIVPDLKPVYHSSNKISSCDSDYSDINSGNKKADQRRVSGYESDLHERKLKDTDYDSKYKDKYAENMQVSHNDDKFITNRRTCIQSDEYKHFQHPVNRISNHTTFRRDKDMSDALISSCRFTDSRVKKRLRSVTRKYTRGFPDVVTLILLYLMCGNYMLSSTVLQYASASSVNDCRGVRYAYLAKGLDLKDVPRQPRQGTELQICPRGLTCCTEEMEKKLWIVSKDKYGEALQSSASAMQRLFSQRSNKFNGFFTELLIKSKLKFHRLFRKTYGIIYERNSDVFIDFFRDLESYYDHGNVDLEEALRRFFTHLYQRMFTVFNAQHNFSSTYLSCVSQTMKTLQPFGDVPQKLTEQLRRSFVATRTFSQALMKGKQIIQRIVKIQPKDRCVVALTKMSSCPACQGIPEILPCNDYCVNVMKGCLAYHAQLDSSWDKFIDNLQILADRLMGPFDIEDVVDPIGVKISDAIMNFQNSGYDVTTKVYEDCGTPRIQKRQAPSHNYEAYSSRLHHHNSESRQRSGRGSDQNNGGRKNRNGNKRQGPQGRGQRGNKSKLKSYIKDVKNDVGETKGFWTRLPYGMCKENNLDASNAPGGSPRSSKKISSSNNSKDKKCWNGKDAGRYTNSIVNDGLHHQEYNPEVPIDLSRYPQDAQINQQIRALRSITQKIENAHKGLDVDWPVEGQHGNDFYPEGSGGDRVNERCNPEDTDDEDCYYDYDHSGAEGSGDDDEDTWNDDSHGNPVNPNGHRGSNSRVHDTDDDTTDNYPPWVTKIPDKEDDISVDGNCIDGSNCNGDDKSVDPDAYSKRTSSGTSLSPGLSSTFRGRAMVYYMLPTFMIWLGRNVIGTRAQATYSTSSSHGIS